MHKKAAVLSSVFILATLLSLFVPSLKFLFIFLASILFLLPFCVVFKQKEYCLQAAMIILVAFFAAFFIFFSSFMTIKTASELSDVDATFFINVDSAIFSNEYTVCEGVITDTDAVKNIKSTKATVFIKGKTDIFSGQRMVLKGRVKEIEGLSGSTPYSILENSKIVLFSSEEDILYLSNKNFSLKYLSDKVSNFVSKRLTLSLPDYASSLTKAILFSDKSALDNEFLKNANNAGVMHIFAVSGLHISVVFTLSLFLTRPIFKYKKLKGLSALLIIWGFVLIAGASTSCLRAGFMCSLFILSTMFYKGHDSLTALLLSGVIIVLKNPLSLSDCGFLLSFLSTLGIVLFNSPVNRILKRYKFFSLPILGAAIKSMVTSLSATILTLPVTIAFFGGISAVFIFANIIILPFVPLMISLPIVLSVFSGIPFVSEVFKLLISLLSMFMIKTVDLFGSFKYSFLGLDYKEIWFCLLVIAIVLILILILAKSKRVTAVLLIITILSSFIGFYFSAYTIQSSSVQIKVLTDSDASRLILYYKDKAYIIADKDDRSLDNEVVTFLKGKNIKSIECFISLFDDENKTFELNALNKKLPVRKAVLRKREHKSFLPNESISLELLYGYDNEVIVTGKDFKITSYLKEKDAAVLIEINGKRIVFTNSKRLLYKAYTRQYADLLYYCGDYYENVAQFAKKYVILLKRPIEQGSGYKESSEFMTFSLKVSKEG